METFIRFLRFIRPARWFATLGAAVSFGTIAFGGVGALAGKSLLFGLTLTPAALPIVATVVFFFAVSIESAIFKTSIYEASERDEKALKRAIAKRELKKLLKNADLKENIFLTIYQSRLIYLKQLIKDKNKYYDENKENAENEIIVVQQEVEALQLLFFKALSVENSLDDNEKNCIASIQLLVDNLSLPSNAINQELKRKKDYITYISIPFAIGTGVCAGLFTLGALFTSWPAIQALLLTITGISLGPTILLTLTISACIFASKGYCLMMYNTVTEMIQNDTLYRWGEEVIEFFKAPKNSFDALKKGIKVVGILALTTLMVFATIGTAGTWWHLAAVAVKIAPVAAASFLKMVHFVSSALMIIPTFLFNIINGLESAKKLYHRVFTFKKSKPVEVTPSVEPQASSYHYLKYLNPFFYLQKLNPFAFLFNSFIWIIYQGHVISSGFTADQSDIVSASVGIIMQSGSEAFTDLPFIDEQSQHTGFLLKEIEALLGLASICWHYVFGNLATFGNQKWRASQENFYPSAELPTPPIPLTEEFGIYLRSKALNVQIDSYQEKKDSLVNTNKNIAKITKKMESFQRIKKSLPEESKQENIQPLPEKTWQGFKSSILQQESATIVSHRNPLSNLCPTFPFWSHKPESDKVINRIVKHDARILAVRR